MVNFREGEAVNDSVHQRGNVPSQVHGVHERTGNAARVRLRVRLVVRQCSSWTICHRRSPPCACALKRVYDLGIRVGDIEEVIVYPRRNRVSTGFVVQATVKDAAHREQDNNGSTSQ